jgi:hypothetical protein
LLKYRKLVDLTDEEVRFILTDIFEAIKVDDIHRDMDFNTITAQMTTGGWGSENEEITDTVEMSEDDISVDFGIPEEDLFKWQQFLLAKGCDRRLLHNPYMQEYNG